jgi:predicted glycosyltransferase
LKTRLNILICPLEWGLGHAARMIPVAFHLRDLGHNVIIGSGEKHTSLFRNETTGLSYISFPGFSPGYSRLLPQYLSLLFKTPLLLYHIISEHSRLKKIIRENSIDIVISDNRFGLWNRGVTTAYFTHMPRIPFPKGFRFLEFIGIALHRTIIRRYDFCFIPDIPGSKNLTGRLSHDLKNTENTRFTGILSRFKSLASDDDSSEEKQFDTVILSGPEPQRGILKKQLENVLGARESNTVILEGNPGEENARTDKGNISYYNHLSTPEMEKMISGSRGIISRSGYSTIMELVSMNRSALIIPTPGQTEQEYLAAYLAEKGWFSTVTQDEITTDLKIPESFKLHMNEIVKESSGLLTKALTELLEKHHEKGKAQKS